jgi:hypothetical protein
VEARCDVDCGLTGHSLILRQSECFCLHSSSCSNYSCFTDVSDVPDCNFKIAARMVGTGPCFKITSASAGCEHTCTREQNEGARKRNRPGLSARSVALLAAEKQGRLIHCRNVSTAGTRT